jgi:hypothetical protein
VIAAIIETLILMGIAYGVISAFVTLHFHWAVAALLPATFLIITGIGYSLIIGGMTLLWKRIQLLQEGVLMLVMNLSGGEHGIPPAALRPSEWVLGGSQEYCQRLRCSRLAMPGWWLLQRLCAAPVGPARHQRSACSSSSSATSSNCWRSLP